MNIIRCLKNSLVKFLRKINLIRKRRKKILLLGLDDSGKTSFILRHADGLYSTKTYMEKADI